MNTKWQWDISISAVAIGRFCDASTMISHKAKVDELNAKIDEPIGIPKLDTLLVKNLDGALKRHPSLWYPTATWCWDQHSAGSQQRCPTIIFGGKVGDAYSLIKPATKIPTRHQSKFKIDPARYSLDFV